MHDRVPDAALAIRLLPPASEPRYSRVASSRYGCTQDIDPIDHLVGAHRIALDALPVSLQPESAFLELAQGISEPTEKLIRALLSVFSPTGLPPPEAGLNCLRSESMCISLRARSVPAGQQASRPASPGRLMTGPGRHSLPRERNSITLLRVRQSPSRKTAAACCGALSQSSGGS